MALQELYGDYKPQGLVGGMVSGLNTGANLGSMFANTASTNQQTSAREQKLPWEIAQSAANVDRDVMTNDTTRATQAGQIAATNATNKTAVMTQEQAQQIIPYETFNKVFQQQSQQAAVKFTEAAQRIRNGEYDSVFSELLQSAQKPEEKAAIQKVYQQYKNKPQEAAAYAQKMAEKSEWDRLNTDPEKVFEMWKITAMNAAKLQQERIQASAKGSGSSSDKMSIDQRISDAEAKKAQLLSSGAKPNDPRVINLVNLVNSLNAARSKSESMVIPQGGLPSSTVNYGSSFNDLSGGGNPAPAAKPNIIKLK